MHLSKISPRKRQANQSCTQKRAALAISPGHSVDHLFAEKCSSNQM